MTTVWTPDVDVLADPSAGGWIGASLSDEFGVITRVVSRGYAAYARVLHPPGDADGEPTSWKAVASHTGRTVHSQAQWHALVFAPDVVNIGDGLWPHGSPERGSLAPEPSAELHRVLAHHTTTPQTVCSGCGRGGGGCTAAPP